MADDDDLIPDSGAVFTFGRSRFADNIANKFWIKNDPVLHVACGDEYSAVLTERGRVYVFGSNEWGQLGLGHLKPLNKPSFIKALKPEKIILLACGRSHTLVYSESRKLFSFGSNGDGQLGHGDKQDASIPKEISALSDIPLKNIACGAYHSVALTEKGEVYVWGVNSDGQLGLGEIDECTVPTKLTLEDDVISLSCGYYHSALITENGLLFTFGENENGKLGLSDSQCDDTTLPQSVRKLEADKYVSVSCGARHTVATTENGCCYSWGDGSHGQLGHGTMQLEVPLPKQIDLLNNLKIIYASSGDGHTAIITNTGKIYTFGDGRHGKLGQGDECFSNLFKPTIITRFNGFHVKFVACGGCHMLVGAIRKNEEDKDMVDSNIIAEEEDTLNASMYSNKSIAEANMTLKPSSITYPLANKPRDKWRHKKDDPLNNSLNLNTSLNNSLNMAQLSRNVVQLPTVLDRSRLPKIAGVNQISINNYSEKESGVKDGMKKIEGKVDNEDGLKDTSTKKTLPELKEKKQQKNSKEILSKKSRKDTDSGKDEDNEEKDDDETDGSIQSTNVKENILLDISRKPKKENSDDDEEEDSEEDEQESKNVKKQKGKIIPVKEDKVKSEKKSKKMKDSENEEDEDNEDDVKKPKGKLSPLKKSKKVEESENEEDEEEDEDDVKKLKGKVKSSPLKKLKKMVESENEEDEEEDVKKRKGKVIPVKDNKVKSSPNKSKKVEESENEEEDEDDEDDDESVEEMEEESKQKGKIKEKKGKMKSQKNSKKIEESEDEEEDDDEEEEDEDEDEDEEESYEESPVMKKKTKKTNIQQKEDPKGKRKNKEISKETKVKVKTPEKKLNGKKKKNVEEEMEHDDDEDEDEEEEDEEEEDDEEEDEDDDTEEDDDNDGEGDDEDSELIDNKKDQGKNRKKKEKSIVVSKEVDSEEPKTEMNNNRSGFLNFFRRNKKPQVDAEPSGSKSPEKTPSPSHETTNKNQSKTCTLL